MAGLVNDKNWKYWLLAFVVFGVLSVSYMAYRNTGGGPEEPQAFDGE